MVSTECPICCRHFRTENLALHVESCLQKSATEEKRKKRALDLASPLFPSTATRAGASSGGTIDGQQQQQPPQQLRRHSLPASGNAHCDSTTQESTTPSAQSKKRKREQQSSSAPLAERMRPSNLDDLVGQEELLGPGKLLSSLIQADRVPNMILWG